jgi:RNA polymerase sigma-70 factor (ECF subfamily)
MVEHATVSVASSPLAPSLRAVGSVGSVGAGRSARAAEETDEDLVVAVLAGERAAEEALYRRHAPSVLRLTTRLLRSHEDAMDVLQDTFVSAFDGLKSLRAHDAFRSWIHSIAVRLVHRRFRRRRLLGWLGLGGDDEISLESLADESASQEAKMELRWLDAALARIEDRDRVAWMLRNVEGLSLDEIASACECSLATVKRRIANADALVRRHFDGGVR